MTSAEVSTLSGATTASRGIRNPVLTGFHPDPSILRVGSDYYIATSTFEWYPGVRIHHSVNLVDWTPLGGALNEKRLLDLTGTGDSNGVWAPNLTYAHGEFHLLYSDVATFAGGYWDPQNFLVTGPTPTGPWSDPVVLHGRGFDASLFHDDDGATWMLSMVADWRPGRNRFGGISIQQYDPEARRLAGPEHMIFTGTAAAVTEAPNLYRKDGWYYLVTAEGGTSWEHQVTVARSSHVLGPYLADPAGPLLTSVGHPELTLQKAGHGSLVETPSGQWYLAHLVGRPYTPLGRCVLGRESAIQEVTWTEDGWPRIADGRPADTVPAPVGVEVPAEAPVSSEQQEDDDFDSPVLGVNWSTLRRPATPDWVSLTERPSHLRIHGGRSPMGRHQPSLVARRVVATGSEFEADMEFTPRNYRQLAGITAYYNTRNWYFLHVTADDDGTPVLDLLACDSGRVSIVPGVRTPVPGPGPVRLGLRLAGPSLSFSYEFPGSTDSSGVHDAGPTLDATTLSDEYAASVVNGEPSAWGFTGAFVGLWVQDLGREGAYADFDRASYRAVE
ncbi:glycoside hydrolase family 43 protein [Actinoplanes sp. Pm04-4]|uniref:Glycoside hydrolase family 43 protein n=1 Tax=Paractinoplanes pyxinae TaxID=2997416 RepID=A0ABT4AY97_9ACTN|nr:glycoside hydrolase family 43 protein [Actinoplanes pyxinae]MCY1139222.1 glycoside hydrolase family 43 protein [Actinoplanes pyxinae]